MTCDVKVILDSINKYNGIRLTTLQLRYWRGIHAEFMTHRVFSRNASSSRAIPIKTMLKQVWNDPAGPIHWGANQAGMQAHNELTGFKKWFTQKTWSLAGKTMCCFVWLADKIASPHKQTLNRLLEPWQYISVIVTATEWSNFFNLRIHPDAQPEIQELASAMKKAMDESNPVKRLYHLPYILEENIINEELLDINIKLSIARCARVSYLTHDGNKPSIVNDINLYTRLVGSEPIHASPTEHQAVATNCQNFTRNFRGWVQYRSLFEKKLSIKHES